MSAGTKHPTEDLTALLDGALPPARAEEVRGHLATCPACRAEKERLASAVAALGRLPPGPEPSPFLWSRLAARLAGEARPRPSWAAAAAARLGAWADLSSLRWKLAVPAAAAVLAGGIVLAAVRLQRAEEKAVAENLELLLDYEAVSSLDDVSSAEDVAVIALLDEIGPAEGKP